MASAQKGDDSSSSFVDQLRDIQGEYLMLSELYDKEKAYGRKLAETMRLLQYEVDVTIPINKDYLSDGLTPLREAFLASEAVVIVIDEDGNKSSRPLERFPPDVILSIIQDCTPELKRLISERRRTAAIKVNSLEKVLRELRKAQTTFKQTRGESVEEEVEEDVEEEGAPAAEPPSAQGDQRQAAAAPKAPSRARDSKEEAFAFRASFLEKKEAPESVAKT